MKSLKSLAGIAWGVLAASAVQVSADEVTKTWALELPEASGITNKAPVVITDGNYRLRGWIASATGKTIGIGGASGAANFTLGQAICKDDAGKLIGSGDLDMRGALTVDGVVSAWTISTIGAYSFSGYYAAPFDVCVLPTTLTGMQSGSFQGCGRDSGFSTFRLHAPNMTGDLPNNTFLVSRAPTVLDLKIPKVTCFGGYWSRTAYIDFIKDTDVGDWDLSSVQLISTSSASKKTDDARITNP